MIEHEASKAFRQNFVNNSLVMRFMSDTATQAPTAEELNEIIAELEKYRERLINDMTEAGKKAKMMKGTVMSHLDPELKAIDERLEIARKMLADLG